MKPSLKLSFLRLAILILLPCLLVGCGTSYIAPITYTIGGMVSGLSGTGLVLQDNGGNNFPVAASGSFTFTTAFASGGSYAVTVLTQPSNSVQNCVVTSGSGTASANVTSVQVTCTSVTFTIGGMVSGLSGTGLVLQDNGANNLSVTASGSFTFTTAVASGGAYAVTVLTQPSNPVQNCVVTGGSGTASANVTNVQVTCTLVTGPFTIGGTVTNLSGAGNSVVLQNNGGNNLSVTANGSFTFTTAVASGGAYAVTVSTPPSSPAQTCSVANGSGTANANVTNVTVNCGHNEWAWMSGSNVPSQTGTYGTLGVAAVTNVPGFRNFGAVSWTDTSGNLWLFGGNELTATPTNTGDLNDLWEYSIQNREWTWVSGSNLINQNPNYGTLNMPATTNVPGARDSAVGWIDASGNLWLFGGLGNDSTGKIGYLNDLWEYSVSTNEWTWKGGSNIVNQSGVYGTLNTAAVTNIPGARAFSTVQIISGEVWLFGGFGTDSAMTQDNLNDLWEYTISSGEWTWMGGLNRVDGVGFYGTKGTAAPANIPRARYSAATWTDTSGNFWLFGGSNLEVNGTTVDSFNDLWEFSTVSKEWAWINGSNVLNQIGTYGTQGIAASGNTPGARSDLFSWTDPSGNFWLFGGFGYDSTINPATDLGELNDLWEYSLSTNDWTWKNGSNVRNQNGTFGTLGQLAPGNIPASREGGASWADATGNLWLFAGSGANAFNDLWMYFP
jgi:N-acetylneuraminic acid mutarotase